MIPLSWGRHRRRVNPGDPAPFPEELADRAIRMFNFVGDTVLDPFVETGTIVVAAAKAGPAGRFYSPKHDLHLRQSL